MAQSLDHPQPSCLAQAVQSEALDTNVFTVWKVPTSNVAQQMACKL